MHPEVTVSVKVNVARTEDEAIRQEKGEDVIATQAAEEIYALGGNSVDAAIAASFVLSVVEPTMSGLGGRSLAMVRTSDGEFYGYDGMTEIPKGFAKSDSMPSFGYSTVATPGTVATLGALHKRHGRLDFYVLLQPDALIIEKSLLLD